MKRKLIIFGNNGFAEMVAHYFEEQADREVVAFTAHERFISTAELGSRALLPFERIADEFSPADHELFVALEHGRQNVGRAEVAAEARDKGYRLASFVSPTANVSSRAQLGEHCLILENSVIQYGAEIGANNFIFANSFFGQSCRVGANNYFGSAFFADRHARIGSYSVFGSQVRVAESVVVHDWAHIQAFETLQESLHLPTIIHPILRTPGHVVDKRQAIS
jgi:UDP-3-O-[3-hydroxymyristoyl] glucosamine N-acyltransferase